MIGKGILNSNAGDLMGRVVNVVSEKDGAYLVSAPNEDGKEGFVGQCDPQSILILLPSTKTE